MTEEARRPTGIIPAVVTPFDEQAEVVEEALATILNHLIEAGVHGVFVCGSTGEYWALSPQEKQRIFEVTVATAKGRVPVFAGTGADTTALTVTLSQQAEEARADFVSVVTPSTIRPTDDELYQHYATVARNVDIPLVLYNNPARTGVHIAPSVAARLAEQFGNVVGIKDSSGDLTTTGEFMRLTPELFAVLAGRDTLIYPTLAMGGAGAIAATANIVPELVVRVYE
ncbi:MAG: 4-hydroxy-tetrahydrodipicolinate synthase, partial [Planctomycetes bacterium]|nr:4-hydroxy-tetrahydrodipicolinate synthase [Planctomycetota bacterium]